MTPAAVATSVPAQPGPTTELWLEVLAPTPAYSMTDEVLWTAAPGEWYRVLQQEAGWVLGAWENDPPESAVWIELDSRVQLVMA
jgi:hypothetical protein